MLSRRVNSDEPAAGDGPFAQHVHQFISAGRVGESLLLIYQCEQLENIAMRTVPRRWIGRQPRLREIRILAERERGVLAVFGGVKLAFEQLLAPPIDVDGDGVHERRGGWRIGVFYDQRERCRCGGDIRPVERRGDALAVRCEASRYRGVIGECGARELDPAGSFAQIDGVSDDFPRPARWPSSRCPSAGGVFRA